MRIQNFHPKHIDPKQGMLEAIEKAAQNGDLVGARNFDPEVFNHDYLDKHTRFNHTSDCDNVGCGGELDNYIGEDA